MWNSCVTGVPSPCAETVASWWASSRSLGLLGGVSLFALAGARRTQSSYPRFLRVSHASTMAIDPGQYDPTIDKAIASRPEVVQSTTYVGFNTGPMVNDRPDFNQNFETIGTFDGRFFTMDRFAPTQGRLPNVDRDNEIAVNEAAADLYGYRVGQHLDLGTYSDEQLNGDFSFDDPPAPMIRKDSTIVGIGLFVDEVVQDDTNREPLVLVTPAFTKEAAAYATYAWQGLTLRHGDSDVAAVKAWYVAQLDPGSPQFFRVTSVDTFHAQQAVRPLSLALAFFGGIAFVAALVLVSQAVNRRLRRGRADQSVLFSMGASTRALAVGQLHRPRPGRRGRFARGGRPGVCVLTADADRRGPPSRSRSRVGCRLDGSRVRRAHLRLRPCARRRGHCVERTSPSPPRSATRRTIAHRRRRNPGGPLALGGHRTSTILRAR